MEMNDKFQNVKKCPACGKITPGNFCTYCGENLEPKRFTTIEFIKGFPEIIFGMDFNIFRTIYQLVIRPGQLVTSYFYGNRKKYYKPLPFFFTIGGIVLLLFLSNNIVGPDPKMYEEYLDDKVLGQQLDKINQDSLTGILMLQFPVIAIFTWLFFRNRKYKFGEHLVANAFFIGEISITRIILFPLYYIYNKTQVIDALELVYVFVTAGYYIYAFYDWFYNRKTWKGFFIIVIFVILLYLLIQIITLLFLIPLLYIINQWISAVF